MCREFRLCRDSRLFYLFSAASAFFAVSIVRSQVVKSSVNKPRFLKQSISIYAYTYILSVILQFAFLLRLAMQSLGLRRKASCGLTVDRPAESSFGILVLR
jgi:hypothetical protein